MSLFLSRELRTGIARRVLSTVGVGTYTIGAATGLPYPRFLGLRSAAERAFWREDLDDAERLARELLSLADRYQADWNHGNAIHHGQNLLGRIELKRNRLGPAIEHLLKAGKTKGSPQLNSFGPNMTLAQELLEVGERKAVLEFLDLCRVFWTATAQQMGGGAHPLDRWQQEIEAGDIPDFGANLLY